MVKTNMSADSSENEQPDSMTKTKDKLKIQQRLIDFAARNLQSSRLSSFASPSSGGSTNHGGEGQSVIEENIRLQENKLMKGFSRQLILKHQYVKQIIEEGDLAPLPVEQVKRELDKLINLELFLNVIGMGPKSIKALLSAELTLDVLYLKTIQELEQLLVEHEIPTEDGRTLLKYLDHLSSYYEMWERGEQPSTSSYERMGSTTSSRLSSVSTLGSMDFDRANSTSSMSGLSPLTAHSSSASTTPTPLTPSSSQSLLSPSPFTTALTGSVGPISVISSGYGSFVPYNRSHSSSSSMLLSEVDSQSSGLSRYHHSVSSLNDPKQQGKTQSRKLTHKRSLSNPLANIILHPNGGPPSEQQQNSSSPVNGRPMNPQTSTPVNQRSPSPPVRSGSQPVISSGGSGSPNFPRGRNPQLRKIVVTAPTFSQSISNDQLMPTQNSYSNIRASGSDAFLNRQNTWQGSEEFGNMVNSRCNSLVGSHPPRPQSSQPIFNHEMTSTSMVDLPMNTMYSVSSEHLDQIDEYSLPNSGKSQSVPKLTFMSVSSDERNGIPSTSAPTSPRTPGMYTPTGHLGHAIMHRFTTKTFMAPHVCDVCKKTFMIGVRCKDCKYKCHKSCAVKAPHSCGLSRELMEFVREQIIKTQSPSPSTENFVSSSEQNATRPRLEKSNTVGDYTDPKDPDFFIQDLTREPTKSQFSPVMTAKKSREMRENGRHRHELYSRTSTSSLLMVPNQHLLPSGYRSTSSSPSPSTSPPTSPSPSLTPSSPRSPNDVNYAYSSPQNTRYENSRFVKVVFTDESGDESYDGHITSDSRSESPLSSKEGSTNDISDFGRLHVPSPTGKRPGPQIVMTKSLPDLLNITGSTGISNEEVMDSTDGMTTSVTNGYVSDDNYMSGRVKRKESLQRTVSTADSKTSTLVNSITTEEDDYESDPYGGSQGEFTGMTRVVHRNSVVDEWNIPYENIRILERVGCGPVGEVYRGNWHGEVAIKRFNLLDATPEQIGRFKEEVSVLKKTRHENLALFMGASLTVPNLAIVTSFCKGHTLYKYIHTWSETFPVEKSINIARQIAQAMGYLHARGIVHKDLNTKNIFLEKDKVVITDTGLSTLSDSIWLHQPNKWNNQYVVIPRTKLFYFASELVRALTLAPEVLESGDFYPYSEKTDVYAFGTVMYEMLFRKFPFSTDALGYPMNPSTVIFLVGQGKRAEMNSREIPKRVRDLVWDCWHSDSRQRLPFSTISEILIKLSRRKTPIARSPSFPISLSRSTEALNFS